ncbi:hypothetical protein [Chelativorans alearense]|uniref:hypothetical protein n=1 Tax=Chelativorans alearense TaxID=2681495 RepID=UPI0013D188D7|nr:hypothetical protein [Chelativorans alearense]
MRDTAGERADRLKPLRLVEAGLKRLALGLAPLARDRVCEDFRRRPQQRDVIVPPMRFEAGRPTSPFFIASATGRP